MFFLLSVGIFFFFAKRYYFSLVVLGGGFNYHKYMVKHLQESQKRSFVKSMTFRIIVIVSDAIITYAISHRYDITIGFVVFTNVASTALYYFHERVWARIGWGSKE